MTVKLKRKDVIEQVPDDVAYYDEETKTVKRMSKESSSPSKTSKRKRDEYELPEVKL